jgi:glycosyltransferase involved in cell wall biosynthesis
LKKNNVVKRANRAAPYVCVVIPAYKVSDQIIEVVRSIGPEVSKIIVIDDACPDSSGKVLIAGIKDPRLEVIFHSLNTGVGGAVITGYKKALLYGCDVVVKVDGDGQMDTARIIDLIQPTLENRADYTKGNRFFEIDYVKQMPKIRIVGNLGLSFMTKLSTGYWHIFDPNNGFTAIHKSILERLNLEKIDKRYFFESDMLFRLNLLDAKVLDIAIPARYGEEKSSLKIRKVLIEFPIKHTRNLFKRIVYMYYLRDFKLASIELPLGIGLGMFGLVLGFYSWLNGILTNTATPTGTLVLIAMSSLAGLQLILAFFSYDTNNSIK